MSVKIDQSFLHVLPLPDSGGLVCVTYKPGHNVHWIQALRSANDKEASAKTWSSSRMAFGAWRAAPNSHDLGQNDHVSTIRRLGSRHFENRNDGLSER